MTRCGIGLRREHYGDVLAGCVDVPWFEVISENFLVPGGRPLHVLDRVRQDYPVSLHGVSLSLGGAEPLDRVLVRQLRGLVERVQPFLVSDHLCWTGLRGLNSHDLLPLPFTEEAVRTASAKIRQVQDELGRAILIENVSSYIRFRSSTLSEWEFLSAVAEEAECGILLDVNNVFVNSRNHGFDPLAYLAGVPASRVGEIHLAGHEEHADILIDTHDRPIRSDVWALYREAIRRCGPVPTLIERDAHVPPLPELLEEAAEADRIQSSVGEPVHASA